MKWILKILPDVGEQTGAASVRETVGEIIRTVVSMGKYIAPLGATPAPLRSKPRPELAFQPPGLAPAVLRRDKPGTNKPAALKRADDVPIVQWELDVPSDLRCPRHPQASQEPVSLAAK